MCGRVLRHVGSYLYVGAEVPRLLQFCEHLASAQPGGLPSAPIRCRMQLQLTGADACFVDPPYQRNTNVAEP